MDGVRMKNHITHFKTDTSHVLLRQGALLRGPLETRNHRILNFVQILNSLTHINHHVRPSGLRTKTPNLLREILIPTELFGQELRPDLRVVSRANSSIIDGLG
ncbi:hypothetical protein MLD38_000976 [Melastoma candidum]|uniref:Uncharacterized protein n=1 Tax=Melastoma candidum TaxID=119954 RepID=A0ACB9SGP7_9MYRT|nr:hypothetical protein MLD38_000976 [Melastoma candidum]